LPERRRNSPATATDIKENSGTYTMVNNSWKVSLLTEPKTRSTT
jgi:hypothetical protein